MLQRHLERAERALTALAGNQALCAIARTGQSFPAAKFHEGAVSALAQVRRARRRADPASVAVLAATVAAGWREQAGRMIGAGPDWQAHLAGGAEAVEALLAELTDE